MPRARAVQHLAIEHVAPGALTPAPYNPRTMADAERKRLERGIREFGLVDPIIARRADGMVIGGHQRLASATALGLETVPVVYLDDISDDRAAALNVLLNNPGAQGTWDFGKLSEILSELDGNGFDATLTGFDDDELARLLSWTPEPQSGQQGLLAGADPDAVPDVPKKPITKPGDLILLGQHRLLCGDATSTADLARLLDGTVPDLCLTDPPYCSGGFQESGRSAGSVGTDAAHKQIANDRLSTRGYQALLKQAFSNTGAPFLYAFTDWRMWVWLFDVAESCGYGVRSMIVWDKGTPGMGRGWRAQHELILWACKATPPFDKYAAGQGNVIGEKRTGNVHHTTEKPVGLRTVLLRNTPFAQAVVDPFAGSGTTLIACQSVGRTCFASELDPAYCDVIVTRWENATGQTAERP